MPNFTAQILKERRSFVKINFPLTFAEFFEVPYSPVIVTTVSKALSQEPGDIIGAIIKTLVNTAYLRQLENPIYTEVPDYVQINIFNLAAFIFVVTPDGGISYRITVLEENATTPVTTLIFEMPTPGWGSREVMENKLQGLFDQLAARKIRSNYGTKVGNLFCNYQVLEQIPDFGANSVILKSGLRIFFAGSFDTGQLGLLFSQATLEQNISTECIIVKILQHTLLEEPAWSAIFLENSYALTMEDQRFILLASNGERAVQLTANLDSRESKIWASYSQDILGLSQNELLFLNSRG